MSFLLTLEPTDPFLQNLVQTLF